jgi:hypothetical protein
MRRKIIKLTKDSVFVLTPGNNVYRKAVESYNPYGHMGFQWINSRESMNIKSTTVRTHIVDGWRPATNYTRSIAKVVTEEGDCSSYPNWGGYFIGHRGFAVANDGSPFGWDPISRIFNTSTGGIKSNLVISNLVTRAETEALNKLRRGEIGLGEEVGQTKQTLHEIASAASTFFRAYRAARKGDFSGVASALGVRRLRQLPKTISEAWLAYQYGWKPLLQDVYTGYSILQGQVEKPQLIHVTRRVAGSYDIARVGREASYRVFLDVDASVPVSVTCRLYGRVNDQQLRNAVALGLENPAAIAWELLPFSFVIDWFLPIGNALWGLTAPLGLDFQGGSRSIRVAGKIHSTFRPYGDPRVIKPWRLDCKYLGLNRAVYFTWPWSGVYIKSPFTTRHIENAIALLVANYR